MAGIAEEHRYLFFATGIAGVVWSVDSLPGFDDGLLHGAGGLHGRHQQHVRSCSGRGTNLDRPIHEPEPSGQQLYHGFSNGDCQLRRVTLHVCQSYSCDLSDERIDQSRHEQGLYGDSHEQQFCGLFLFGLQHDGGSAGHVGRFLCSQRTHDFSRPARPDFLERIRSERLSLGDKSVIGHCHQCHQWSVRRVWQRKSHSHRTGLHVDCEQRPWDRQYESAQHELPWQLHAKLRARCSYFCVTYLHSRQGIHLQGLVWRMHGHSIDLYRVDDCLSLGDSDLRTFKRRKAIASGPTTPSTESSSADSKKPRTRATIHLDQARRHAAA